MAALVVQFGAVLSLFLAHMVAQMVSQKAGLFGKKPRLRSAFAGGGITWLLVFSGCPNLRAQEEARDLVPQKWGLHLRAADPGVWTIALSAQGKRRIGSGGGWQVYLQCSQGGMAEGRLQRWMALDDQVYLGSGFAVNTLGIGSFLLSVGGQHGAAHISIPLRQPAARPLASSWQWSARVPLRNSTYGVADLRWRPGALPLLSLTAASLKWALGAGAAGAWLSWGHPIKGHTGVEWRVTMGVLRGDVPWMGWDWGSVRAFGSDPAQQWHLSGLWP